MVCLVPLLTSRMQAPWLWIYCLLVAFAVCLHAVVTYMCLYCLEIVCMYRGWSNHHFDNLVEMIRKMNFNKKTFQTFRISEKEFPTRNFRLSELHSKQTNSYRSLIVSNTQQLYVLVTFWSVGCLNDSKTRVRVCVCVCVRMCVYIYIYIMIIIIIWRGQGVLSGSLRA